MKRFYSGEFSDVIRKRFASLVVRVNMERLHQIGDGFIRPEVVPAEWSSSLDCSVRQSTLRELALVFRHRAPHTASRFHLLAHVRHPAHRVGLQDSHPSAEISRFPPT